MGIENLSLALYDQPGMVEDMVDHWSELCARQIDRLPADIPVDMASKNGPLLSPAQFRRFIMPGYRRVMEAARRRGGLDKEAVARGPRAIADELRRVRPLVEQGGYVPHLDHLVPPTVLYDTYLDYLR